ncbi:MAG TPA: sigma-70 family RNA polymerase sigma factor [Gemmataceae bacterium]|nr:sigma-70 family RNA polymerase sigma factor [Gemmataceae bacterium]
MPCVDPSDAEVVERFQAGDGAALDLLFERYERPLFHFLVGMLRDHHLAEDALQETFVRALRRLDGVDPNHLRGWLFTVAYHQAMLTKRKRKHSPQAISETDDQPDLDPDPEQMVMAREDAGRLRALLESLPPGQREVIQQRVYEGKRFREIAAYLNCPLNTALARMHEGLKRLRILWGHDNGQL